MIQKVGTGQQRPGKMDVVTIQYTVWRVADEGEESPPEDPLRWTREGPQRVEELARVENKTVTLGEGHLPVGIEVCVRMMLKEEKALVHCSGRYGMITSPIFTKRPKEEEERAP